MRNFFLKLYLTLTIYQALWKYDREYKIDKINWS